MITVCVDETFPSKNFKEIVDRVVNLQFTEIYAKYFSFGKKS
jgi:hypothetical protein